MKQDELIDPPFSLNNLHDEPFFPSSFGYIDMDSMSYKQIMGLIVKKYPLINPNFLYNDGGGINIVDQISENTFKLSQEILNEIKKIFMDVEFICSICAKYGCTFSDILDTFFAYFGELLFKRVYFYKWLFKTIGTYTKEQRDTMSIPAIMQEMILKENGEEQGQTT